MKGLEDGSKNYLKKLRKTDNNYNSNIYSTKQYLCQCCIII